MRVTTYKKRNLSVSYLARQTSERLRLERLSEASAAEHRTSARGRQQQRDWAARAVEAALGDWQDEPLGRV